MDTGLTTVISRRPSWFLSISAFASDLEITCLNHFVQMLPKLMLSSAHPGFEAIMVRKILHNILLFDGLRNVAIACGAAHLWMSMKQPRMNELALSRYYRAIREVSRALPSIDGSGKEHYEAVQTAIMFLYIHGVSCWETHSIGD